jgi:predicted O-linked N-acetylglucosamine transferase (SPINDLY family)
MQASALMDEAGYVRKVEAAYREMWRRWCAGEAVGASDVGQGLQRETVEVLAGRLEEPSGSEPKPQEIETLGALLTGARYTEALTLAQTMTARFPLFGPGWKALGVVFKQMGRSADALAPMQTAAALLPGDPEAHSNLGVTLQELGRLDEAEASYRRALEIKPDYAEAHYNLGVTFQELGRLDEAEASYRRVLRIRPDSVEAHSNLGNTLNDLGRLDEAEASYRRALQIRPDNAEAHYNLGFTLQKQGRLDEAAASYRRALQIRPDNAEAHNDLGNTFNDLRLDEAEASYRRALQLKPDFPKAHNNLGIALQGLGRLAEAVASYRRALELKPDFAEAHSNLGTTLQDLGRLSEAEASYRRALELKPDYREAHSNLLFMLNYHPDRSAEEVFSAYRQFDDRLGRPLRSQWRPHGNDRLPSRRLRVGYVSPDFRRHTCRHFIEPLLDHHDISVVEVFAYAEVGAEDEVTARMKTRVEHWVPTVGMSDAQLADRIRADRIDILVDLAGHTRGNRLLAFARKPAPVSVTTLGYGYTTGLSAIDWYLTDPYAAPEGSDHLFSERPWRISQCLAYRPAEAMGAVSPLPAIERGHVTFATLTRAVRINHRTVKVWSEILHRVPGSVLWMDSGNFRDAGLCQSLARQFANCGIDAERLQMGFHSPPWDLLREVDITLDCFPHNSGTTLFESLYMGVPFISLAARPSVGRLGSSILANAGHAEWIAASEEEYVDKAAALAADLPRLAEIRQRLRAQMQASALMDEAGYVRKVEAAYREMWRRWCAGEAVDASDVEPESEAKARKS